MRIAGEDEVVYDERAGAAVIFCSELWHRTVRASPNTIKLTIFFGVKLS